MSKLSTNILFALFLSISLCLLAWSFQGTEVSVLKTTLHFLTHPLAWALASLNLLILFCKHQQWRILLKKCLQLSKIDLFLITSVWYMADWLYPMKLGEATRLYLFKKHADIPRRDVLANIVIENMIDGASVVFLWGVSLLLMSHFSPNPQLKTWGLSLSIFLFAVWLLLIFLSDLSHRKGKAAIFSWLKNFAILKKWDSLLLFLWELGVKGIELSMLLALQKMLGLSVPMWAPLISLSFIAVVLSLPMAPARLGTFEAAGVFIYLQFGMDKSEALMLILLFHLLQIIPATFLGLIATFYLRQKKCPLTLSDKVYDKVP